MPKPAKPPKVVIPPAPTAPGGAKPMPHADSPRVIADSAEFRAESPVVLGKSEKPQPERVEVFRGDAAPDTATVIEAALKSWRCPADGQRNTGARCTTCGTVAK